ncbi:ABC transporter substrate-binding protein [Leptolyngbya sp. FACHB-36]|uniref:bifunctional serine/threonine-protein kinase/ABC transporter substrate-binding protein n=1 Tax=Leptolyngbya sp. FACHB-36 TaxID=2692808 RepID=UPI0016808E1D|nr:bifunctional serine/threonine-protein kinase/ABC transporter substrate-binding protein [Leptolyngbya sp. FACHB-36]MBD2022447.1 ABC transporter substrate-binding protein [Leptolyngbya sp. FACHB-36]
MDAMLGKLLSARYKVINVLGSGGFGHTYIAEDTQRPGNPCCVLKHLTFASTDPIVLQQVRRLFRSEAETLERLGKHDQIPRLLAYFEENREFYLVQEFIEGQPLSEEIAVGPRLNEEQTIALLEDVLGILEFVHAEGVIHRDIKPENLIRRRSDGKLVLIDFGAVKAIEATVAEATGETNLSLPVYTSGYSASEQCLGRPQFSSDLYSLGMVAIQALTRLRPSQFPQDLNTGELIWRDHAEVSPGLATVIETMTRYHFNQRYRSVADALQALRQLRSYPGQQFRPKRTQSDSTVPPRDRSFSRRLPWQAVLVTTGAVAAIAVGAVLGRGLFMSTPNPLPTQTAAVSNSMQARISLGERSLNPWQTGKNTAKQDGVEHLAVGNYALAVASLSAARQADPSNPEILIYLNNARIGAEKSYRLAAAVPFGDDGFRSTLEILRGVAQAQDEVNRSGGINGVRLKVAIANDDNRPDVAESVAKALADDPEVLGVIGHSISDVSIAAAPIYQAQQLVMISPLSSAVQLSNSGSYIFRTMPSDRVTARTLASYLLNRLKQRRVAVFYNSTSTYSASLMTEFKDALFYNGVELVDEFDLSRADFDADDSVNQAIAKGAKAIMLAPDYRTSDRAIQVVQVNRRRLALLTGDSIYTSKLLKIAGGEAVGMVLGVPAELSRSTFQQRASALWGKTTPISWRTALAYDAAQALITAVRRNPTRNGIQRLLSQSDFSAAGADGIVSFLPSGDRHGNVRLVTISPLKAGSKTTYTFKPLP